MTDREREKQIFDTLLAQQDNTVVKTIIELLEIRLMKHKDSLLTNEDGTLRGRGLECRDLLKNIKGATSGGA